MDLCGKLSFGDMENPLVQNLSKNLIFCGLEKSGHGINGYVSVVGKGGKFQKESMEHIYSQEIIIQPVGI